MIGTRLPTHSQTPLIRFAADLLYNLWIHQNVVDFAQQIEPTEFDQ